VYVTAYSIMICSGSLGWKG